MTVTIDGTNGVTTPDVEVSSGGSASTPAITVSGDTNTGIFFPAADTIAFAEGGAEAMRIDSSGRVGIGTTSPSAKLHVESNSTTVPVSFRLVGGSADTSTTGQDGGAVIALKNLNTGNNTYNLILSQDAGDNSTSGIVFQNNSDANNEGTIAFLTRPSGGSVTERARITSGGFFKASNTGGYLAVGSNFNEFNSDVNTEPVIQFQNTGASFVSVGLLYRATRNTTNNTFYALSYFNDGAGAYKWRVADSGNVTNTNNSYGGISDVKLKQDIVDAGSQWDDIKGLRVRKYHWKSDPDGFMQMGLVAQEAELVSPGLIDEHPDYEEVEVPVLDDEGNPVLDENGEPQTKTERNALGTTTKSVKYSVLYMKAVKALQEAMERIETLEAKVAALEAR